MCGSTSGTLSKGFREGRTLGEVGEEASQLAVAMPPKLMLVTISDPTEKGRGGLGFGILLGNSHESEGLWDPETLPCCNSLFS